MAARGASILLSRISTLSRHHLPQSPPQPPNPSFTSLPRRHNPHSSVHCLNSSNSSSSSSGGGVSDDYFVSTRKSSLDRGFSVILKMLKRIELLDNSVISQSVSDSAKDSMKQTISTMLGLLPSDQFSVRVHFTSQPFDRLIVSSIITGYTLWNAEYRISLMRNYDIISSQDRLREKQEEIKRDDDDVVSGDDFSDFDSEKMLLPQIFQDLSPEALNYINQLQTQISDVNEELSVHMQKNVSLENERGGRNNLLEYLRSLDAEMVTELSRPSSPEVEEIIHQLVQNVLRKLFKENEISMEDSDVENATTHQNGDEENCGLIDTSRDYLAKLLFW
ncbi:hypothetical protein ACFE04_010462 [Oxalis oulophora]